MEEIPDLDLLATFLKKEKRNWAERYFTAFLTSGVPRTGYRTLLAIIISQLKKVIVRFFKRSIIISRRLKETRSRGRNAF
jgi:hypothetical protein